MYDWMVEHNDLAPWLQALGTVVALIALVVTVLLWIRDKKHSVKNERLAMARSVALETDRRAIAGDVWRFNFRITNFSDYPIDDVTVWLPGSDKDHKTYTTIVPNQIVKDSFAASAPVPPQHPDYPIKPIEIFFNDVWSHRWKRAVGICEDVTGYKGN